MPIFGWKLPEPEPEPAEDAEPDLDPGGVGQWRYDRLIDAGWPDIYASILALDQSIDLHQACELLEHGCSLETAWDLLT